MTVLETEKVIALGLTQAFDNKKSKLVSVIKKLFGNLFNFVKIVNIFIYIFMAVLNF